MQRGDLVRVDRPDKPLRYGVVLDTRPRTHPNPQPGDPRTIVQALVRYEDGTEGWCWTRYVFIDNG